MGKFVATPTMSAFVEAENFVNVLAGPVGSGKSVCCSNNLFRLSLLQDPNAHGERCTRHLIVRNTADQLRSTTIRTFHDWFPPGVVGTWRSTEKTLYVDQKLKDGTRVKAEFMFMPLDTPDDVRKALSLELTFLWGNEWRELHPDVVDGLLMRLRRYPSRKDGGPTRSMAFFDTNMPDMDSWHYDKMENPPGNWSVFVQPPAILSREEFLAQEHIEPDPDDVIVDSMDNEWWLNPRADNLDNLDERYYRDIIPGKTQDFIDVYLRCKYGRSLHGVPVYDKTFNESFHVVRDEITPVKSPEYPVVIGIDFGRTPAAVFVQRDVYGRIVVMDELVATNMGLERFLETMVRPLISRKYMGCSFVAAPDPAGFDKTQINELSPVDVLKRKGFRVLRPASNLVDPRIQAVENVLTQHIDGKAMFVVSHTCTTLVKGFKYGYRYKLKRNKQQEAKPDKNEFSHPHDALQYAVMVAMGNVVGAGTSQRREVKRVNYAWG